MGGVKVRGYSRDRFRPKPELKSFDLTDFFQKEITIFQTRFNDKLKETFYLELSTLLKAGLDIKSALDLIESEQSKAGIKSIFSSMKEALINGSPFWECLRSSNQFTPYEYFSVQIGEETGKMAIVLEQLYVFFHNKLKQRRQLVNAISYPVIILITSLGAVIFMLLFIVPMFQDVFKRFGGQLPLLTKMIISIALFVKSYFWLFSLFATFLIGFLYYFRKNLAFRKVVAIILAKTPVVGKIAYSLQLARFCSSMELLIGSKVSMVRSIDLINHMVTFYPIQSTLPSITSGLMNGKTLHASMTDFKVYSAKMIAMVRVGEEVNKLETFFSKLAEQFRTEAEHQTSLLNTFLEPAMIIFLGFVVGFILLAMYLPMFELSTSIGG